MKNIEIGKVMLEGGVFKVVSISKETLLRIYKQMIIHKDPNKIWLKRDFLMGTNNSKGKEQRYFHTLEVLGLIEAVDAVYKTGNGLRACRSVKGWRLKFER